MKIIKHKKSRGQGIVSVIVASAVGAIVLGFLTDMLVQQGISQKFLTQKLEINDLTGNLFTTFSKANNCICQFSADAAINPNSANYDAFLKFDSGAAEGSQIINVKKIYAGCRAGAQMPLLIAEEGQPLPNSSSLRVDKVEFVNLRRTGGALNEWQGQWRISFQVGANSAIRSVRPVLVTQKVTVNPADVPNTRITSCSGMSSGTGTLNFLAKWSPISGVLEDSAVFENDISRKIGIGTTTPIANLHTTYADAEINIASHNSGIMIENRTPAVNGRMSGLLFRLDDGQAGKASRSGIFAVGNAANGLTDLVFAPSFDGAAGNPTERMRITTAGRVGIKTVDPSSKIHMKDDVNNNSILTIQNTNAGNVATAHLCFKNDTQPDAANNCSAMIFNQSTGAAANYWAGPNSLVISNWNNGPIGFFTNGPTERVRIAANGNVGIGTTSPSHRLSIEGDGLTESASINVANGYDAVGGFKKGSLTVFDAGVNKYQVLDIGAKDIRFITSSDNTGTGNGPVAMVIKNTSGNVGIGTQTPAYPLHVQGNIYSSTDVIAQGQVYDLLLNPNSSSPLCRNDITGLHSNCTSDRRLKTDITDIHAEVLDQILLLKPVEFRWLNQNLKRDAGFIAQEVKKIFPLTVTGDEKKTYLSFSPGNLVPYLIRAFQEFFQQWHSDSEQIHEELEKLRVENTAMKAYLCSKDKNANFCR